MAIRWSLSILGLYEFDNTIFDNFHLPDGLDRQPVIDAICIDTAGLSTIYTSPQSLAHALDVYSERRLPAWNRAYKALTEQYNILNSQDIQETVTRTPELTHETNSTRTPDLTHETNSTRTPDTTTTVNTTRTPDLTATGQNSGSDSTTEQTAAFNGNTLTDRSKTTTQLGTSNTVKTTGTEQTTSSQTETGTEKNQSTTTETGTDKNQSTTTETGTDKTTRQRSGYTSPVQDRILQELALCQQTVTDMIVREIKYNFCVMIY